jgi:hypothetical protein
MNGETDESILRRFMLEAQSISGAHDIEKFDGRDLPSTKVKAKVTLDDLQNLIKYEGAWQHGKTGEVPGESWMIGGNFDKTLRAHSESPACAY